MTKYKVTYFVDGERKIIATKEEVSSLTIEQYLQHSHVISVVVIPEKPIEKVEKTETKLNKK